MVLRQQWQYFTKYVSFRFFLRQCTLRHACSNDSPSNTHNHPPVHDKYAADVLKQNTIIYKYNNC